MNILHIDSSALSAETSLPLYSDPRGNYSISRNYTSKVVDLLKANSSSATVVYHDLDENPIPYLSHVATTGLFMPSSMHTPEQVKALELSTKLANEILKADTIVLGVPTHNFMVPAVLKSWVDHAVRFGITVGDNNGIPVGLSNPKTKVIACIASGGDYSQGSLKGFSLVEDFIVRFFGNIGITDISFVNLQGLAGGLDAVKNAMEAADRKISEIVNTLK